MIRNWLTGKIIKLLIDEIEPFDNGKQYGVRLRMTRLGCFLCGSDYSLDSDLDAANVSAEELIKAKARKLVHDLSKPNKGKR